MKGKQILILTNNVAPYRHPLFSLVTDKFSERGARVQIWFMREREATRSWDVNQSEMRYEYEILPGMHLDLKKVREIHFNPSLLWKLVRLQPDIVIIGGYNSISSWIALLYCRLFRRKVIMWNGSILNSSKFNHSSIRALKRCFVRYCDAFISYGTKAKEFLEYFGADSCKIFVGCNVGDVEYYRKNAVFESRRVQVTTINLIFVGQLIRRKGIYNLLEALAVTKSSNWQLYVVGDGPEESDIKIFCEGKGLSEKVIFIGFKQKRELSNFYNMGDIFVLPSLSDPFGIVYSEALASGLFVIASIYAGASYDIITDGLNGFVIDPHDIEALAACIDRTISMIPQMSSKKMISDSVVSKMEHYAQQFIEAADYVFGVCE
ncbi:MAG: glycosyltransferase family 1 protein [Negativicutes bacterium]|nr:glycosyltransferase family 1 protein [Negativicutes bacterium]